MSFAENNKRAAKNTLLLYFRMLVVILANLYITRAVLEGLGVVDYGIYTVVGGFVVMLSFISNSMNSSTQRFLSFELGRDSGDRLREVFSAAVNIHVGLCLLLIIVGEGVGVWFLNSEMTIPADRMTAANWVLQISLLTACVGVFQIPYNAAIIAHEDMGIFAKLSLFEVGLKVAAAVVIRFFPSGRLVWYAAILLGVQVVIRLVYQIYCRRNYKECRYCRVSDRSIYKKMSGFAGWSLIGATSWMLKVQGTSLLMNVFFGPVINAAVGVATQIRTAISGFIFSFMAAINPQITKYYARGELAEMESLAMHSLKYSFFLLLVMVLPVCMNIDFLLSLWLETVPPLTAVFTVLVLLECLLNSVFDQPLMFSIAATGDNRRQQIYAEGFLLFIIPFCYVALKLGAPPQSVFIISMCVVVIAGIIRFQICKIQLGYKWSVIGRMVLLPSLVTTLVAVPLPLLMRWYFPNSNIWEFICNCGIGVASVLLAVLFVGMNGIERANIFKVIKEKFLKR